MSKETNRTTPSDKSRVTGDHRPQLMKDLAVKQWANVPVAVLEFLTADIFPRPVRILALLIRQSWGYSRPDAIRGIKRTKYGHEAPIPLLQRDIVEILGIEKEHVSRTVTQLERIGALIVQGKRLIPVPNPVIQSPEKLPDSATFFADLPIFQALEKLKSDYRAELTAAVQAAVEPVRTKYLPRIQEVNTQFRAEIKAAKKKAPDAAETSAQNKKVAKSGNFSESSPVTATSRHPKTADDSAATTKSKVAKSGNFSELSPVNEVAKNGNFQPRINIKEIRKGRTPEKTARGVSSTEKPSRSVGQATDRPTEHAELLKAIQDTGICEQVADTPTEKLLSEMAARLNGAPLEALKTRILARHQSITNLGMLRNLATDVGKAHTPKRPPTSELRRMLRSSDPQQSSTAARAILSDPSATAQDRADAQELLAAFQTA